jgi:hypothetical protein
MNRSMHISMLTGCLVASIASSAGTSRNRGLGDTLSIEKIRIATKMDRFWLTSPDSAEIVVRLGLSGIDGKVFFDHSFFYRRDRRMVVDSFRQVVLVPASPSSAKVDAGLNVDRFHHIPKRAESISGASAEGEVRVLSNLVPNMTDSVSVELVADVQGTRKVHFESEFHLVSGTLATDTVDGSVASYSIRFVRKRPKGSCD